MTLTIGWDLADEVDGGVSSESLNVINLSPVQEQLQYSTQVNKQTNVQHPPVSRYNAPVPQRNSHRLVQHSTWNQPQVVHSPHIASYIWKEL